VFVLDFTRSFKQGSLSVGSIARAASERSQSLWFWWLVFTSWLLADKFALWSWAHQWLSALPVAVSGFAQRSALWLWGNAGSVADWRRADSLAFWAVILFAQVLWASNGASWLLAVNIALWAREFLALLLSYWPLLPPQPSPLLNATHNASGNAMIHPALLSATQSAPDQSAKCNARNSLAQSAMFTARSQLAPLDAQRTCAKRMTAQNARLSALLQSATLPALPQSQSALLCAKPLTATGSAESH